MCYLHDTARLSEFYQHADNQDKLWVTGAADNELTKQQLPWLLAVPMFVAEFLVQKGGACLPHNLQNFMTTHIDGGASQVPPDKWQLVLDWCLAALQGSVDGSSILNIGSPEPALCQDNEFLEWCELHLAATLGNDQRQLAPLGTGEGPDNLHLVERITSNMGRSFMMGVQALAPTIAGAARQGGLYGRDSGGEGMGGKLYSENNVATLKGYCGVTRLIFPPSRTCSSKRERLLRTATTSALRAKQTGKEINEAPFSQINQSKILWGLISTRARQSQLTCPCNRGSLSSRAAQGARGRNNQGLQGGPSGNGPYSAI